MKFTTQKPTTDPQLSLELKAKNWHRIKEPKNFIIAFLWSLPCALLLGALTLFLTYQLNPSLFSFLEQRSLTIHFNLFHVIFLFVFVFIHEIFHLILIPNFLKSQQTFFGIKWFYGFVYTTEEIKKSRFILISLLPYFLLSIVLPCVLAAFGLLNGYGVFLCVVNAFGSSVDLLNVFLILQVPRHATIITNGFETFYQVKNGTATV